MTNTHFVFDLRRHFDGETVGWRLAALRQEPLVWDSLISTPLGDRALEALPGEVGQTIIGEDWSPAALALLALELPISLSNLRDPDWVALEPEHRQLADQAYEAWTGGLDNCDRVDVLPKSLVDAGWIALALRERYVFHGSWGFLKDILRKTDKPNQSTKPVIACLVGMVPDPNELLLVLLMIDLDFGTHAFLCQPATVEAQSIAFSELITKLPETDRMEAISILSRRRADLASHLSKDVFDGISSPSLGNPVRIAEPVKSPTDRQASCSVEINLFSQYTNAINSLVQKANAFMAAQWPESAIQLYQQAQQVNRSFQGYLISLSSSAFLSLPGEEGPAASLQAWEQAIQLDPEKIDYIAEYSWALLNEGRYVDAKSALQTVESEFGNTADRPSLFWSSMARLAALEHEPERAIQYLHNAIEGFQSGQQEGKFLLPMAELALELEELEAADRLTILSLEIDPTLPRALALRSQVQLAKSQPSSAVDSAELAFCFLPDIEMQHLTIQAMEANGEWTGALEEYNRLISRLNPPTAVGWREMAICAQQAGQPEAAIGFAQEALNLDPDDGLAIELLGEIALSEGNPDSAMQFFQRAVQVSPEQVSPWLRLARLYRELGRMTHSLETLRQASQAIPESAEIHLALGQTLLREDSPTLALIPLRRADTLIRCDQQQLLPMRGWNLLRYRRKIEKSRRAIALSLGKTLRVLGYLEESKEVFEQVSIANVLKQTNPVLTSEDLEFSYNYAQTLIALGENVKALPLLEFVATYSESPSVNLDYARAILSSSPEFVQVQYAIELLDNVLGSKGVEPTASDDPNNLPLSQADYAEASALLAESLRTTGDLPRALQAYRQALDSDLIQQPDWRCRLSSGLGQVAVALGYHETAIASFLEACQDNPSDPILIRNLAEAYTAVDLSVDAYKAACEAVRLDNDNPEMLIWFAELCANFYSRPSGKGLPVLEAAVTALESAINLAPERGDLLVRLATLQLLSDDHAGVLTTLNQLSEQTDNELVLTISDFQQAAELLSKIGEPTQAADFILQAIRVAKIEHPIVVNGENHPEKIDLQAGLFFKLSKIYQITGDLTAGLAAVDEALLLAPDNRTFHLHKSNLQLETGNLEGAIASLERLATLAPNSWETRIQLAIIHHATGALMPAIEQSEAALECLTVNLDNVEMDLSEQVSGAEEFKSTDPLNATEQAFTRWVAAELAHCLLMDQRARAYLSSDPLPESFFANSCLLAELALNQSDLESAASAIGGVVETRPHHPLMLALQARIGVCQEGITATNLQLFRSAIEYFNDRNDPIIPELLGTIEHHRVLYALQRPFYMQQLRNLFQGAILQGLVEAALELNQWQDADEISEKCCTFEPESPAAYLLRVRVLVLRAEIQRLCQALQIIKHAPGQEALSEAVCQAFEHAVLNAADRIALNSGAAVQQVTRWRVRGKAVFVPDQDSNAALLAYCDSAANKVILTADDLAALIWSLGYSGQLETAAQWSQRMPNDSLVNTALALSISECDPERAIYLTHQSLERLADPDLNMPHARPMLSALIALVAHRVGARPEEHLLALASIQTALKIWPDEARWHALAADILLSLPVQVLPEVQEQPEAVISVKEHLEHAARLEPDLAEHHLKLGQWHANHGEINLAINETEKATFIEPDQMEPWLELANLQKEAGYLEQAVYSSERALGFTSQPLDALLLRCELAFLTNNPRGTLSRAQAILNLNPKQPKAWFLLAKAHETLEQLVEALSAIEKAISYSDQPQEMQQTRVRLLRSLYGPQTAIQAIQSLLEVYTAEPVLNTLLADYWIELGEPANAIQAARIALQTGQVRLSGKTQAHLHLLIGAQSRTAGQLDQAVYHLNEAIRKDPENIDAFLELGRAHQDRRQNNQALEIYQMAAKIAPHDYRPYYQAGIALKDIKDYLEAETMFRRAARLAPNEVSIHRQLAAVVALNLVHNRRVAAPSAPDRIE